MSEVGDTVYIYGICDPRAREVRYVGSSINPPVRFTAHLAEAVTGLSRKAKWLREMRRAGVLAELIVFDAVPIDERIDREEQWIEFFLSIGQPLTNGVKGVNERNGPTAILAEKVAERYGVSVKTVIRDIRNGVLQASHHGNGDYYVYTACLEVYTPSADEPEKTTGPPRVTLTQRIAQLEARVAELEAKLG